MVSYRVRRLHEDEDRARHYHLFDGTGQLLVVADQGSEWLPAGDLPQVRFARPDGERVASMDLPRLDERRPDRKQNYAVIYEHAVYALITAMDLTSNTSELTAQPRFDRLVIEVEGNRWLGLRWTEHEGPLLILYDMAATGLSAQVDPEATHLPEPLGLIEVGTGDFDFDLTLPAGRLMQGPLLGLALVFLVDGVN